MTNNDYGLANKWLRNIKEVYRLHAAKLESVRDPKERENLLVELNVMEQVRNLGKTTFVQRAWKKRRIRLHGWVIDLSTGYIKELPIKLDGPQDLEPIFRFKF
ncbi:MAG: hypothetical protein N2Z22_10435 [Turneriella sp.]|nr:hypothetical protein [Turneriella sp.]